MCPGGPSLVVHHWYALGVHHCYAPGGSITGGPSLGGPGGVSWGSITGMPWGSITSGCVYISKSVHSSLTHVAGDLEEGPC